MLQLGESYGAKDREAKDQGGGGRSGIWYLVNGPRLGPVWASPFSIFAKYDIIVLDITHLKGCLVMSLGIDNH